MLRQLRSAGRVAASLSKFVRGPKNGTWHVSNIANAGRALTFLAGRKLGQGKSAYLDLGFSDATHSWALEDRNDLSVLEDVFLSDEYSIDIPPPRTIVDLGANFGAASVSFAHKWPQARIYAVEPNPKMFERLLKNAAHYDQTTCLNCAVGGLDGSAKFHISADHVGSSFKRRNDYSEAIDVEVKTLSSLMSTLQLQRIDLLKFDVEGAEEFVFRNIHIGDRVGAIVGEVHPDLMTMTTADFIELFGDFDLKTEPLPGERFVIKATRAQARSI